MIIIRSPTCKPITKHILMKHIVLFSLYTCRDERHRLIYVADDVGEGEGKKYVIIIINNIFLTLILLPIHVLI